MFIVLKIAVLPEVKKYLSRQYEIEPFILTKKNKFGLFLYHCLVKFNKLKKAPLCDIDTSKYSEELCVRLSEDMWRRKGYYIHPQNQIDFNSFVSLDIDDWFYLYMKLKHFEQGKKIQHAIYSFREEFGLTEDELTLKCLEKKYERHRIELSA